MYTFLLQMYSCFEMLLDGTTIGEYLLSQEMKVGNEVIPIPSDEVTWLSQRHAEPATLLSLLNSGRNDVE